MCENAQTNLDSDVAEISVEPGISEAALAVCEIDGVVMSVVYCDGYNTVQIERNLAQRHLPPLKEILAPLDMRRKGRLSRGGIDVTGWQ